MPTHSWNEHTIEVASYAAARLLWFGIGFSVVVDGSSVYCSPTTVEGLRTVVPFQIRDAGVLYSGRVESGRPCSVLRAAYRVILEGQEIASGVVRARNWYVTYGIILAALTSFFWFLYFQART